MIPLKHFKWHAVRGFNSPKDFLYIDQNGRPYDFTAGQLILSLYSMPGKPNNVFTNTNAPADPPSSSDPGSGVCPMPPLPPYPADPSWYPPGSWIPGGELPYGFFPDGFLTPGTVPDFDNQDTTTSYGATFSATAKGFVSLVLTAAQLDTLQHAAYQAFIAFQPTDNTLPTVLIARGNLYIETPGV